MFDVQFITHFTASISYSDSARIALEGGCRWVQLRMKDAKAKVMLSNGKVFEIEAQGASDENKYIQSATLNGKEWNKPWFSHDDIKEGGKLVLVMGSRPNKAWGSAGDAVPPSAEKQ